MISLQQAIADAYKPRPIISVDEWADNNRMLSSMSSAEPTMAHGQISFSSCDYARFKCDISSAGNYCNERCASWIN